jgi:phosphohistidine phosphatase SixA
MSTSSGLEPPPQQDLTFASQDPSFHYLYLIRHGDRYDHASKGAWKALCESNEGKMANMVVTDPPLSTIGFRQAVLTAKHLETLVHEDLKELPSPDVVVPIYSSPYQRCIQTCHPLAISSTIETAINIEPGIAEYGHVYKTIPTAHTRKSAFPEIDLTYVPHVSMTEGEGIIDEHFLDEGIEEDDFIVGGKVIYDADEKRKIAKGKSQPLQLKKGKKESGLYYFRRIIRFARRIDARVCGEGIRRLNELDGSPSTTSNVSIMYSHAASSCLVKALTGSSLTDHRNAPLENTDKPDPSFDLESAGKFASTGIFKLRKDVTKPETCWELVLHGEDNSHSFPDGFNPTSWMTQPFGYENWHNKIFNESFSNECDVNSHNTLFVLVNADSWRKVTERPGTKLIGGGKIVNAGDKVLDDYPLLGFARIELLLNYANDKFSEENGEFLALKVCRVKIERRGGKVTSIPAEDLAKDKANQLGEENDCRSCEMCNMQEQPKKKLLRCSLCKTVYFCDVECQRAANKVHRKVCKEPTVERSLAKAQFEIFGGIKNDYVLGEGWINRSQNKGGGSGAFTTTDF